MPSWKDIKAGYKDATAPAAAPTAYTGTITPWAGAALDGVLGDLSAAVEGTRNDTLNRAGFRVGQLVAGGQLPNTVLGDLVNAAKATGLEDAEIRQTINSAWAAGAAQPDPGPAPEAELNFDWIPGTAPTPTTTGSEAPSWAPLDLTGAVNGTHETLLPTVMPRTDGVFLLYPGKVHSLQGESESGKSMLMHAETARLINAGKRVLFIDFESDQNTVVDRLKHLGATAKNILAHLDYINPECRPFTINTEQAAWLQLLDTRYALAVIDGVTEAFAVFGVKSIDNDEVTAWGRAVPRTIANRTGAPVVVVDHVTKSADGRGRYAIGAQAKMSYLSGASYTVEVTAPLGVGMVGRLVLRVGKDRPGQVRPQAGAWRKFDRTQEIAVAVIDSTTPGRIDYTLQPQDDTWTGPDDRDEETLTKVSQWIEQSITPASLRSILSGVRGGRPKLQHAIEVLAAEGYIRIDKGPNNTQTHCNLKSYQNERF